MSFPRLSNTLLLLFTSTICIFLSTPLLGQKAKKDLILLIGQSNMAGRGQLDTQSSTTDSQIWMIDSNNVWIPAKDPVHFDKPSAVGVGPGLSFAQAVVETQKNRNMGLIPCAEGGSGIDDWKSGARHSQTGIYAYDAMVARVKTAKKEGKLKAILWHQGEQDSKEENAAVYEEKLIQFFRQLRKDTGAKKTPIILATLGDFYADKNPVANRINKIITELPGKLQNVYYVSSAGLGHKGDEVHFSTAAQRALGKRYAEKYLEIIINR